ncbi:TonB-dependent receptor [Rhodonellum sp.]|uniref:TonB-dependent receptor n=1 Tax=Rhodonellum sp. TaxID=2231180 RepID=UPI00271FCB97|nr:TonB-dependent receptor [Rhodonellum sp.]MDO9554377.1 TonB-dependent receptor [Rhodonellum sp.]
MKTILSILLFFLAVQTIGQTLIKGSVKDQKGQTIPGVNIFIKNTYDGTSSDLEGNFQMETELGGTQTLMFQAMGFKSQELEVVLNGSVQEFHPVMREAINDMTAVTITAGAMEASDEKRAVVLKSIDIVTVPSAMGDIVGAFQTLPGTSTIGNDGRLFVRGGDASETAIFIDGMKVGNAFGTTASNVPTRTRFNPNLFKGSFFSTGGYSAEFGQALSSALALNTVGFPLRSQGDVSLMSIGGGFTQTLAAEKSSITASANYFDLAPYQSLIRQNFDWERAPFGWDAEVSARQKWGNNGMVKAYVHTESGGMKIWQAIPGSEERGELVDVQNRYTFAQGSFKQIGKNDWSYYGGISYSNNVDALVLDQVDLRNQNQVLHGKFVALKGFSDRFSIKTGVESYTYRYEENFRSQNSKRELNDHHTNIFSEADFYVNSKFILRGGLRGGHSSLAKETWLDPRLSLAYKFPSEGQLSFAAGQFSQMPVEQLRILNQELQNTKANHLILNYFLNKNGRTFRAEAFYKQYQKLTTFKGNPFQYTDIQQNGEGYAQGFDLFYRDRETVKNTDFWITYSFVDSKRKFAQYTERVQPGFAPRHNGSLVIKHFVSGLKSQIGASFGINDGYTYTNPNFPGQMNDKTRGFQDLSLSWSYLPRPNLILHLACSNVLGRDNIFGYRFSEQANASGRFEALPIKLQAPRFLFLGLFLTLSKDKNANQLNNL